MFEIILQATTLFIFIFALSKFIIVDKILKNSPKSIKYSVSTILFILTLLLIIQMDPRIRKTTDKVLKYKALKIELKFDDYLTSTQIQTNIKSIMYHFKKNSRKYKALEIHPKTYPISNNGSVKVVVKEQEMPSYYTYENKTLTLYISSSLTTTGLNKLARTFETKFIKDISIDTNVTINLKEKSMPTKFIEKFSSKLKYKKTIKLDNDFISLNVSKLKTDDYSKLAICNISFKINDDVWQPWYDNIKNNKYKITALKGLLHLKKDDTNEKVKAKAYRVFSTNKMTAKFKNKKEYDSKIIYYTKSKNTYLVIELESYGQFSDGTSKPTVKIIPTFSDGLDGVRRHCYHMVINQYPYLKSLETNKNFLHKFKGKVTEVKAKNIDFSPYYIDGLVEINKE